MEVHLQQINDLVQAAASLSQQEGARGVPHVGSKSPNRLSELLFSPAHANTRGAAPGNSAAPTTAEQATLYSHAAAPLPLAAPGPAPTAGPAAHADAQAGPSAPMAHVAAAMVTTLST